MEVGGEAEQQEEPVDSEDVTDEERIAKKKKMVKFVLLLRRFFQQKPIYQLKMSWIGGCRTFVLFCFHYQRTSVHGVGDLTESVCLENGTKGLV